MKYQTLSIFMALISSAAFAQDFSIPASTFVGGAACNWHGDTPILLNNKGQYEFKSRLNFVKIGSPFQQGTCEFALKITPAPGRMVVISNLALQFQASLAPYTAASIGYSLSDQATGQIYEFKDSFTSGSAQQGFVRDAVQANPVIRGRCGTPLQLKSVSRVSLSNRGTGPGSSMNSTDPKFKISAVPCQ